MNELLLKISQIVKKFNNTFEISAITEDNNETSDIKIIKLKNNGIEFNAEFFNFFNDIIKQVDENYELIYNEEKGLAIAKKVIKVEYDILED